MEGAHIDHQAPHRTAFILTKSSGSLDFERHGAITTSLGCLFQRSNTGEAELPTSTRFMTQQGRKKETEKKNEKK